MVSISFWCSNICKFYQKFRRS